MKQPGEIAHGTLSRYNNRHCRCAECRRANTEWQKSYKWKGTGKPCTYPGCERAGKSRGVCDNHMILLMRLIYQGTRTEEELVRFGYMNPRKYKKTVTMKALQTPGEDLPSGSTAPS